MVPEAKTPSGDRGDTVFSARGPVRTTWLTEVSPGLYVFPSRWDGRADRSKRFSYSYGRLEIETSYGPLWNFN